MERKSKTNNEFILTISCKDTYGIVAAVSGFLAENNGFIIESAQFGDPSTGKFFMRTKFRAGKNLSDDKSVRDKFTPIAEKFQMKWEIQNASYKPRVLILASKAGHCLNYLLHRQLTRNLNMEVVAVVSNHNDLREMASWYKIPFYHFPVNRKNREEQENQIVELIDKLNVDLAVLARYMQILSPDLCRTLYGKAINIHHSFLPGFKGANPYKQAYDRGVKIIGATAHYVTADLDEGPIIEQEVTRVLHSQKPAELRSIGEDLENIVLARAIKYHIERRVILNENKTVVFR